MAAMGSGRARHRLSAASRFAAVAGVLALAAGTAAASRPAAVVGPDVRETIEREGEARVLVIVDDPARDGAGDRGRRVRGQASHGGVAESLEPHGLNVLRRFLHVNAFAAVIDAKLLRLLERHPHVVRIDLDAGGRGFLLQGGPLGGFDVASPFAGDGAGSRVAILDSGIHGAHPDLGGAVVDQACFCSGEDGCCPNGETTQFGLGADQDDAGHGSNVSGVMISDGFVSPRGVASDAEIVSVKVLDGDALFCCASDVVAGLDWLIENHPEVDAVNMSLGTNAILPGDCDDANAFTMAFAEAISILRGLGVVAVSSTGNDGSGGAMSAPACIADAISVAAAWDTSLGTQIVLGCADLSTAADQVTCYSNTSPSLDLVASGNPMTSSGLVADTSTYYGTSNAAPLVTGCIALMRALDPGLSPDEIESILESSTALVTDATNGLSFPRLDCAAAVLVVSQGLSLPSASPIWLALAVASAGVAALLARRRRR